jgi:hypothetical protein
MPPSIVGAARFQLSVYAATPRWLASAAIVFALHHMKPHDTVRSALA